MTKPVSGNLGLDITVGLASRDGEISGTEAEGIARLVGNGKSRGEHAVIDWLFSDAGPALSDDAGPVLYQVLRRPVEKNLLQHVQDLLKRAAKQR